jgi:hypothetical protein
VQARDQRQRNGVPSVRGAGREAPQSPIAWVGLVFIVVVALFFFAAVIDGRGGTSSAAGAGENFAQRKAECAHAMMSDMGHSTKGGTPTSSRMKRWCARSAPASRSTVRTLANYGR